MKRLLALLLCLLLLLPMIPVSGVRAADAVPQAELWAKIQSAENLAAALGRAQSLERRTAVFSQLSPLIQATVEQDPAYVRGSLIRNGNHLFWDMADGSACGYSPRLRAQMREKEIRGADPEALSAAESASLRGGVPAADGVAVIQPYKGLDASFTNQYPNEGASVAEVLGGACTTYITNNATVDAIARAMESCAVVFFDSHGDTDYVNPKDDEDCTSEANTSYLCLQSGEGLTEEDQATVQGPFNSYKHAFYGGSYGSMQYYCVDGTAIANHMSGTSPNGLLWMAICLGMATDGLQKPLREKGVETVYGYSQSVTFAADYAWEEQFWKQMKQGAQVRSAVAAMKQSVGCPDPYVDVYPAWPIVVSGEDEYPGHGSVDQAQSVNSTWRLFRRATVTAVSNDEAWGTVRQEDDYVFEAVPAEGYGFEGAELVEGSGSLSVEGTRITVSPQEDCTLLVRFAPKTPALLRFSVPEGVSCAALSGYVGDALTLPEPQGLPAANAEDYAFLGWVRQAVPGETQERPALLRAGQALVLTQPETTLYALYSRFVEDGGQQEQQFRRLTQEPDDWAGDWVITWNAEKALDASGSVTNTALGGSKGAVSLSEAGCVLDGDVLRQVPDSLIYTVESLGGGAYSVKMKSAPYYLAITSSTNQLNTSAEVKDGAKWSFSWSDGVPVMRNLRFPERELQYNKSYGFFRCYTGQCESLTLFTGRLGTAWYTTEPQAQGCADHSFGAWSQSTAPSCTEPGLELRVCSVCGFTQSRELPALGHDYQSVVTPPSCEDAGYTTHICSRCGDSYSDSSVPAPGHAWLEPVWDWDSQEDLVFACFICDRCGDYRFAMTPPETQRSEPSCTEPGLAKTFATVVFEGVSYTDLREETVLPALGHAYQTQVVAPGCETEGYTLHVCTRCGERYTDSVVPPTGHSWTGPTWDWDSQEDLVYACFLCDRCGDFHFIETEPEVTVIREPSCTERGTEQSTASVVFQGVRYTDARGELDLPALGHAFGPWTEQSPVSCTEDGVALRVCSRCAETETRVTPAPGHTPGAAQRENELPASCTAPGSYDEAVYCTVCGQELSRETHALPAPGHAYQSSVHAPSCTEAGYTVHVCSRCGERYTDGEIPALGHDFGAWTVQTPASCTEAGAETRSCSRCGLTESREIPAAGHTPGAARRENELPATCTAPGSYDEAVYCTVCGQELSRETHALPAPGHDYQSSVHAPSCTEAGYTVHVCSRCGERYTDGEIPALGHAFGAWTVQTPASCTEAGAETRSCSRCGLTENREIPAPGHTPGAARRENELPASCTAPGSYDEAVYCTVCGQELSRESREIPAAGHTPGAARRENELPASCTAPGSYDEAVYCTVCGQELSRESREIPAPGHTPGAAQRENELPATCTEAGRYDEAVYCTVCGQELSRESREIPAAGHTPGAARRENELPATCTEAGRYDEAVYCTVCGQELSRETKPVEAPGHQPGAAVRENEKAPSCTEAGRYDEAVYCTVCGQELSRETKPVEAPGHSWSAPVWSWTKDLSGATAVFTCSRCGEKQSVTAQVSVKVTKPATASSEGVRSFTATLRFADKSYTDVRTQAIPKTAHDCPCKQFKDMPAYGSTQHDAIDWAFTHKPYQITAGYDATHFAPDKTVTRAQAMVFLWAAKDRPKYSKESSQFADVKKSDWYYKAVIWAVEKGITAGTDATHFSPNKTCNRSEILGFLYAAMGKPKVSIKNPYSDVGSQWYKKAALWAWAKGIEKGEKGRFNPATPCTRASVVTYLYRFLEGKGLLK